MKKILSGILGVMLLLSLQACSRHRSSPTRVRSHPGARVFLIAPKNGEIVTSPVRVRFGIEGIELAPAGDVKENSGHHHLLVDTDPLPPMDQPLPWSDQVIHYGKAQTEASIQLSPGEHTLQLLLGAGNHIPHNPPVISEKITIIVKKESL